MNLEEGLKVANQSEREFWKEAAMLMDEVKSEHLVRCIYDRGAKPEEGYHANSFCSWCNVPLCKMCGYTVEGDKLCNECYQVREKTTR